MIGREGRLQYPSKPLGEGEKDICYNATKSTNFYIVFYLGRLGRLGRMHYLLLLPPILPNLPIFIFYYNTL